MTLEKVTEQSLKEFLERPNNAHCSELLFKNILKAWDADFEPSLARIATPFGGGIAALQDVCGALVGGTMALGYLFGRKEFTEDDKLSWQIAEKYYKRFKEEFGGTTCRHIRGEVMDWDSHIKCSKTVESSLRLLWEVLEEAEKEGKLKKRRTTKLKKKETSK